MRRLFKTRFIFYEILSELSYDSQYKVITNFYSEAKF